MVVRRGSHGLDKGEVWEVGDKGSIDGV